MTTSAIYGRVSIAQHQTENQLMELRAYAERNGWPVLEYLEMPATCSAAGARCGRNCLRMPWRENSK